MPLFRALTLAAIGLVSLAVSQSIDPNSVDLHTKSEDSSYDGYLHGRLMMFSGVVHGSTSFLSFDLPPDSGSFR